MRDDTIFALATAPGRAGVAVTRVSGPAAFAALLALGGSVATRPRYATRLRLVHPASGEDLDDGLVLWFPGPASFTGEDVVEFHTHGGRAVVSGILEALSGLAGVRMAEPGEFTRRAFAYGKLDLTAAEGLADLVDAETVAQRRQALRQMSGVLTQLYEGWRASLLRSLAHLEATLDFPDDDLPDGIEDRVRADLIGLSEKMGSHLDDRERGERLREGIHVTIIGPPNAGKSSLLNRLARRDVAIVSAMAGTTRDVIDVWLDVGGFPVVVADTAGLRETHEDIETEGVRRALARAANADLKVAVFDGSLWPMVDTATTELIDENTIVVMNKADLWPESTVFVVSGRPALSVSAQADRGFEDLLRCLEQEVSVRWSPLAAPNLTRHRHRVALQECKEALDRAVTASLADLMAEDVRLGARSLGRITGRVDVEELLDVIFRDFCVGK